jgi:hypothetical protein
MKKAQEQTERQTVRKSFYLPALTDRRALQSAGTLWQEIGDRYRASQLE